MIAKINHIIKQLELLKEDLSPEINMYNSKGLSLIDINLNIINTAITLIHHSGYKLSIKQKEVLTNEKN
ncbi:unnamed protein product [marine sediment metagenome]|uniref:Uncharacterized protein n=1 Tax=marine sediment metagenome TaxID=412755 RepID=X0ZNK2_9ZZZZ